MSRRGRGWIWLITVFTLRRGSEARIAGHNDILIAAAFLLVSVMIVVIVVVMIVIGRIAAGVLAGGAVQRVDVVILGSGGRGNVARAYLTGLNAPILTAHGVSPADQREKKKNNKQDKKGRVVFYLGSGHLIRGVVRGGCRG